MIPEHKKHEYWNHFIARWAIEKAGDAPHGMTGPKLRKVKPIIWQDDSFWQDILLRHGATHCSPEQFRETTPEFYEHCLGNFWGMIVQTMIEKGLLK